MDEWEAERDWRDDASSGEARIEAPTGLMRATLICSLVALGLAIFVAPPVKRQAQELAAKAQSSLDEMVTGSIHRDPARPGPNGSRSLSTADVATCNGGRAETGKLPC